MVYGFIVPQWKWRTICTVVIMDSLILLLFLIEALQVIYTRYLSSPRNGEFFVCVFSWKGMGEEVINPILIFSVFLCRAQFVLKQELMISSEQPFKQ